MIQVFCYYLITFIFFGILILVIIFIVVLFIIIMFLTVWRGLAGWLTNKVRWERPCPGLTGISRSNDPKTKKQKQKQKKVSRWDTGGVKISSRLWIKGILLLWHNFAVHHHQSSYKCQHGNIICRPIYSLLSLSVPLPLSLISIVSRIDFYIVKAWQHLN